MKTAIFGILGLLIIGLVASTGVVSANGFGPRSENPEADEQMEEIIQAVEDNDFEAWKSAIEDSLTEENFEMLVERHENRVEHRDLRFATRDAVMDGDYDAYLEAVEDLGVSEDLIMSEEDFNNLVEMRQNEEMPCQGKFRKGFGRMMHFGHMQNFGEN